MNICSHVHLPNLTFVGPCIIIYFYSKTNQMHNISDLFYFRTTLYMFRTGLSVHHQESKTAHTASGICTVLDSWWWKERPSKTCRELFQNKINLRYCASGWFYYRNTCQLFAWWMPSHSQDWGTCLLDILNDTDHLHINHFSACQV